MVACHNCGEPTGEDEADVGDAITYCPPCRANEMVLPCSICGGAFGPQYLGWITGDLLRQCACGIVCTYWDDEDLVHRDDLVPA